MRDPAECTASLTVGDGGPAPVHRAVDSYRTQDRRTPATPSPWHMTALDAYRGDVAAGKDALLVCDTWDGAAALDRHRSRPQPRSGPRLWHRPLAG
jgi:hypothetical protein